MLTDPATTTESPYQNQSSSSYATPTPIATIKPTEASGWYYRLWMMYAMPVVIVLGLLNNVISLFVFSSSRLQLAPRLKLYYEAIAVRRSKMLLFCLLVCSSIAFDALSSCLLFSVHS